MTHTQYNNTEEIWASTEFPQYEVSTFGRVRSINRQVWGGKAYRFQKGALKKLSFKDGYQFVNLWNNGYQHMKHVHQLVAIAFIPNPEKKATVNHLDGNKQNNHSSNLEWATISENNKHGWNTGLLKSYAGKQVCQYNLNGELINTYESASHASRITGISRSGISECVKPFRKGSGHTAGGYIWKYPPANIINQELQ